MVWRALFQLYTGQSGPQSLAAELRPCRNDLIVIFMRRQVFVEQLQGSKSLALLEGKLFYKSNIIIAITMAISFCLRFKTKLDKCQDVGRTGEKEWLLITLQRYRVGYFPCFQSLLRRSKVLLLLLPHRHDFTILHYFKMQIHTLSLKKVNIQLTTNQLASEFI